MPTKADWLRVRADFDSVLQQEGTDTEFRLMSGEVFTLRARVRSSGEQDLTDGVSQDRRRVTVMAHRWDAAAPAGRSPQKGDQVVIDGRRHAVEEADPRLAGGIRITWNLVVKG